ncbi:hypothetical protein IWW38_004071 [Coemansia aciculifera]|uniref:Uncharacterized protein n=1 Tax=Coemansia aciculifera TaxID=417176 RepID=A0ACC1M0J1_9FUNG|nr:hypothetical protein IWW38_004071 [Coemansia aciculifera]
MQVDPTRHQPGSYNRDSYTTYGDFVANTGVIRIRPPPMRSPGVGQLSPTSMHLNRDTQSHHHHPYHSHNRSSISHSHTHQISTAGGGYDAQPTSPRPPLSAHDAPRYLGPPLFCPQSPFSPPAHQPPVHGGPPDPHRYPPRHSPMLMSPDSAFDQSAVLSDGPPLISSVMQNRQPPMGSAPWSSEAPAMRSTPPQHMQQSAQPYFSVSPKGVPTTAAQAPAIYARGKADTPPTADCSNSGFQTQPTTSEQSLPLHRHCTLPQSPRLAHSPLASPVGYDLCRAEHKSMMAFNSGNHMSNCILPFSDGVARPRLPPLSEILGKDHHHGMTSSGSSIMQTVADVHSGVGGGSLPDRFVQPLSRRKDSFRDEVSKMLAHEGLH